jgi:class 3 adenylate cyclase
VAVLEAIPDNAFMSATATASSAANDVEAKRRQLEESIRGLESQRTALGDLVVDSAIEALQRQLATLALPTRPAGPLRGERKLVTMMFADVAGFTAMAEKMDPERAWDLLNRCFAQLVPIIEKYGGTIDKYVGDEIVALFGAPITHEDDAECACAAALEMMAAVKDFNGTNQSDLDLHFGINTGRVVVGEVGTSERRDYSVMGHAVNLAARLEDASERGEIFVGEQTQRQAAASFEFEPITLEVKGASGPVRAFRLLRARKKRGSTRGIEGHPSPLVGRTREFAKLQEILAGLRAGKGVIVLLAGDAGIGKSRLTAELRHSAGGIRWHEGRSLSHTQAVTYSLARDLFGDFLGLDRTDAGVEAISRLRAALEKLFGEGGASFLPVLARFFDLPVDEKERARLNELTNEALRRQTFEALTALVLTTALVEPLVLVCEDLHWADSSSLHLLEKLIPLTANAPLFLLFVLRTEGEEANDLIARTRKIAGDRFRLLELEPLTSEASESLLCNLLVCDALPQELKETILSKTEGNAFFLEEVLRSLIDSGAIEFADGKPMLHRAIDQLEVPDTVEGVLAARIDRLPAAEKTALQTAAVLGRIFDKRLLERIAGQTTAADHLHKTLEALVARQFLRPYDSRS